MAKKTASKGGRKKPARRKASIAESPARSDGSKEPSADSHAEGIEPADLSALEAGKLYYRIGEVSQITGVKPYVLRYWESEFRLMAPQKSRSKQRLYRKKDIETILAIKRLLYEERYTIAGARKRLREMGSDSRAELVAEIRAQAEEAKEHDPRARFRRIHGELLSIRSLLTAGA